MAIKRFIDLSADTMLEWKTPGQKVIGHYLGCRTKDGDFGVSKLHFVLNPEGNKIGFYGKSKLDNFLSMVPVGAAVSITYTGRGKPSKGRSPAYLFEGHWDDEDMLDGLVMQTAASNTEPASEDDCDDGDMTDYQDVDPEDTSDEDNDSDTETNPAAEAPRRGTPTPPSAEAKAKAQAALNALKNKKRPAAA